MRYVRTRPRPKSTAAVAPFMSPGDCDTAEVEYALAGRTPLSQLKNRQSICAREKGKKWIAVIIAPTAPVVEVLRSS